MNIRDFAVMVSEKEGRKRKIDIGEIMEILRIIRTLLRYVGIDIYKIINATTPKGFKARTQGHYPS